MRLERLNDLITSNLSLFCVFFFAEPPSLQEYLLGKPKQNGKKFIVSSAARRCLLKLLVHFGFVKTSAYSL